jgi:glycosyltransferase involved in cell wall biosynthesis
VADFRDPWTDINYYQELPHTELARRIDAGLERMVLQQARAVTTVSPNWRTLLRRKTDRNRKTSFRVIHNGYAEADVERKESVVDTSVFSITHVGSLFASSDPTVLRRALQRLRADGGIPDLRIRLVGMVDPNVCTSLRKHGLMDVTELVSYVPHEEAVAYMRQAGLLLLSIEDFPAASGMLTGKLYEYLASGRPVLGVGPPEGDAARLLEKTEGGRLFERSDVQGLSAFIKEQYDAWREGDVRSGASIDAVRPYRRKEQTGELAEVLDKARST